jgi:hypothetical protein
VFATLTAPSFGPVHARRMRGKTVLPCRPRRDAKTRRCPHGRDISCPTRHVEADPRLGQPMCGDCYDYEAAVLFNAHAGDLWRRFITYLPRHLARLAGITQTRRCCIARSASGSSRWPNTRPAALSTSTPSSAWTPPARTTSHPPSQYTADLLCDAIDQAAAVTLTVDYGGLAVVVGFGAQTDRRPVHRDTIISTGTPLDTEAVANYIAKYATKTLTAPGVPDTRIRHASEIGALRCSAHYRAMITTAWQLGARQATGDPRFRAWAHMLGYGGHFLTKSRRYSVTFGQLRAARTSYRRAQRHPDGERDPWGRPLDETIVLILTTWTYAGTSHSTATPGGELAAASAARAREY